MRNVKWLIAAGLLVSATGCVGTNGYPGTSYPTGYGGYPSSSGYYGQPANGYYGQQPAYSNGGGFLSGLFGGGQPTYYQQPQPTYYQQPQPTYYQQPQYVPVPTASARSAGGGRDRNSNGVPDWRERDRNGDGVPDYQQRRRGPTG